MKLNLNQIRKKTDALYIHIPFCQHLCGYCDFTKLIYNDKFAHQYIDELFLEIDSYHIDKVATIYVGGGTPTSLNEASFFRLLSRLSPLLRAGGEFTVEANVESLDENKLNMMKEAGVNRLSIGVESTSDETLSFLNRHHTFKDVQSVICKAKDLGFTNINVDLIYGLPKESEAQLKTDLEKMLSLNVDHISVYSLTISKGTDFFLKGYSVQNEDDSRRDYDYILKTLRENGYERYEISNFARDGKYSKHNLVYWRDEEYYGVGLGASGYVAGIRYENTKSLKNYLLHKYRNDEEVVDANSDLTYYLLTNLRLANGFARSDFQTRFGVDFLTKYKEQCQKLLKLCLVSISDDRIKLTDEGLMVLDRVLLELI